MLDVLPVRAYDLTDLLQRSNSKPTLAYSPYITASCPLRAGALVRKKHEAVLKTLGTINMRKG